MGAFLPVVVPIFLVVGYGYLVVRLGLMSDAAIDGLMRFAGNFAIPILLALGIATLDLSANFDLAMLTSFYGGAIAAFVVGLFGTRFLFGRPWEDAAVVGFCALFSNTVMVGLPIVERAHGAEELGRSIVIVSLHAPICYTLGVAVMEGIRNSGRGVGRTVLRVLASMARNPFIIGISVGFALNLSGLPIPSMARDALDMMVRAALPVALFGLGGMLVRYRPEGDLRLIAFACAVSLLVHPAVAWALGRGAGLDPAALRAAVTIAAMPVGLNAFLFAEHYGRARRVAASTVLFSTILSFTGVLFWLTVLG